MLDSTFQGPSLQQDPPRPSRLPERPRGAPHAPPQQQQRQEDQERRLRRTRQLEVPVSVIIAESISDFLRNIFKHFPNF